MEIGRRDFLRASAAAAAGLSLSGKNTAYAADAIAPSTGGAAIDRAALVRRHNPSVNTIDPFAALTVGNGEFAFTADVTGLQTFLEPYHEKFPLCTTAHWAWHTTPAPPGVRREDFRYRDYDTHGRPVPYPTDAKGQEKLFNWLRQNPHRLHLGRVSAE